MSLNYILSQVLSFVAMVLLCTTYLIKNKKLITILVTISSAFFSVHYVLLKAYTGAVINAIAIIRGTWFYLVANKSLKARLPALITIECTMITASILTWQGVISLIPMVAVLIFNFGFWQKNTTIYRCCAAPSCVLWIVYNVLSKSIVSTVSECVSLVANIVGIVLAIVAYKRNKVTLESNQNKHLKIHTKKNKNKKAMQNFC